METPPPMLALTYIIMIMGQRKVLIEQKLTSDYDDYYDDYGTEGEAMDAAGEMPAEYYDDYNYSEK